MEGRSNQQPPDVPAQTFPKSGGTPWAMITWKLREPSNPCHDKPLVMVWPSAIFQNLFVWSSVSFSDRLITPGSYASAAW